MDNRPYRNPCRSRQHRECRKGPANRSGQHQSEQSRAVSTTPGNMRSSGTSESSRLGGGSYGEQSGPARCRARLGHSSHSPQRGRTAYRSGTTTRAKDSKQPAFGEEPGGARLICRLCPSRRNRVHQHRKRARPRLDRSGRNRRRTAAGCNSFGQAQSSSQRGRAPARSLKTRTHSDAVRRALGLSARTRLKTDQHRYERGTSHRGDRTPRRSETCERRRS